MISIPLFVCIYLLSVYFILTCSVYNIYLRCNKHLNTKLCY